MFFVPLWSISWDALSAALSIQLQILRKLKGELQGLRRVQPGIAMRVIAAREVRLGQRLAAAGALRDVASGHFEMDAAGISAFPPM